MKANELMIGDWVYQALYKDAKIPNKGHVWKEVRVICLPFDEDWAIEPISLTAEILELNGFRKNPYKDDRGWTCLELECKQMYISPSCESCIMAYDASGDLELCVRYVHELQHALRLCGLNELADNFKIE